MALLMQIVQTDNEDNAVLSLKIMIDLHRHYKAVVADQVQPFLDFVFEMYANMPHIVKEAFDNAIKYLARHLLLLYIRFYIMLNGSLLFLPNLLVAR